MRKILALVITLLWVLGVPSAQMQENQVTETDFPVIVVPNTAAITLTSTTNGHDYLIWVALPDGYSTSDQAYPTLYILDPDISFLSVTEYVRFLAWTAQLPQLIVVGVGYVDPDRVGELRTLDYYTSPDDFLTFMSDELFPLIDTTYRTDSTDRALIGFSAGGELVFHSLVNRPDLFKRYIAIDASGSEMMPYLMRDDEDFRSGFDGREVKLFLSVEGTEMLSAALQQRDYDGLEVTGHSLGSATHEQALHLSLPAGILAIYAE